MFTYFTDRREVSVEVAGRIEHCPLLRRTLNSWLTEEAQHHMFVANPNWPGDQAHVEGDEGTGAP